MLETADRHIPVLLERCVDLLAPALDHPGAVVLDATLGMGGHSQALLERCPQARLVAVDRDRQALDLAGRRLAGFAERLTLVHAVYDEIGAVLDRLGLATVDGVLFDLGVSSLQLDDDDRGFSYARDTELDMRMDASAELTAAQVLNDYPREELVRILREYGEERFAGRIASAIVRARVQQPFTTSARLVDLVRAAVPAATRRTGGNPAKRTFQALRIEVNAELEVLRRAVPAAVDVLAPHGRIVVLSYHSLEDRIVKQVLTTRARSSAPEGLPVELPEHRPTLDLLVRGSEQATDEEIAANPRATSVRLRAARRRPV